MAKILVVEDNEQLSEMLAQRLERRGHVVILAQERDAAVSTAKAAQPALILLASQLRGEQDWSTARALKHDDHTRAIPIIVLMANNSEEERSSAMQNGASELHAKPVDIARLMQQIGAAVGEGESDDEPAVEAQ
jgi:DNA-binding response OmpR family regulator